MTATFVVLVVAKDGRLPTDATTYVANLSIFARIFGRPSMDGVYWSIMLEVVFYGWVAVLILAGAFQRWKLPIAAAWLSVSVSNEFFFGNTVVRILLITDYVPFFAAGILTEDMVARGRSPLAFLLLAVAFVVSCRTIMLSQAWMQEHYGTAISYPALFTPMWWSAEPSPARY
jgi:peptidoglycan/LPS O-acetylase OafA/YrhL